MGWRRAAYVCDGIGCRYALRCGFDEVVCGWLEMGGREEVIVEWHVGLGGGFVVGSKAGRDGWRSEAMDVNGVRRDSFGLGCEGDGWS